MGEIDHLGELEVFHTVIGRLAKLDRGAQRRLLAAIHTFLDLNPPSSASEKLEGSKPERGSSVGDSPDGLVETPDLIAHPSAKQFILAKDPKTDIERVACLAYYLTHYAEIESFGTLEISKLNIDAAQHKFTNAAQTVKNALSKGFLIQIGKGKKKLSAMGEQFVDALPDRQTSKEVLERMQKRARRGVSKSRRADNH